MDKPMMHELEQKKKVIAADLQLLLLAIIWGAGFVAGKVALETITPFSLIAFRYLGAALFLLPFAWKHFKAIDKTTLFISAGIGGLMFVGICFQTIGLQYTTPAKQSFIVSSYTVLVPLLSFLFLREKQSKRTAVAAVMAMVGIGILTLNKDLTIGLGDMLTMVFALAFSVQVILTGRFVKKLNIWLYTFLSLSAAGALAVGGALLLEKPVAFSAVSMGSWLGLAYLAFFNTAAAFLLQNSAQRYAPPSHTALIMSSETVFGTIFAILIVGEIFTTQKIIGCAIMFAAILLAELPLPKKASAASAQPQKASRKADASLQSE